MNSDLSRFAWYQRTLDRQSAENYLKQHAATSTFVVRESSAGGLSLSIRQIDDSVAHSIVERTPTGQFQVKRAHDTIVADSLPALLTKLSLDVNEGSNPGPPPAAAAQDDEFYGSVPDPHKFANNSAASTLRAPNRPPMRRYSGGELPLASSAGAAGDDLYGETPAVELFDAHGNLAVPPAPPIAAFRLPPATVRRANPPFVPLPVGSLAPRSVPRGSAPLVVHHPPPAPPGRLSFAQSMPVPPPAARFAGPPVPKLSSSVGFTEQQQQDDYVGLPISKHGSLMGSVGMPASTAGGSSQQQHNLYMALPIRPPTAPDVLMIDSMAVSVRADARGVMIPIKESATATLYRGRWTYDKGSAGIVAPWLESANAPAVSVAVKLVKKPTSHKALAAWSKLQHANVLPLFGMIMSASDQRQVMPFVSHGSLRETLDSAANTELIESEPFQLGVLRDVAAALVYLHSQNVLHRDLAASNVLLHRFGGGGGSGEFTALLAGFSLTREVDQDEVYTTADYNVPLMPLAPEQLTDYNAGMPGCRSTHESDVWAFGVLCCEVLLPHVHGFYDHLFEKLPENQKNDKRAWMQRVHHFVTVKCYTPIDGYDVSEASPSVVAVAKRCLQHMPNSRPPIEIIHNQLRELASGATNERRSSNHANFPFPSSAPFGVPSNSSSPHLQHQQHQQQQQAPHPQYHQPAHQPQPTLHPGYNKVSAAPLPAPIVARSSPSPTPPSPTPHSPSPSPTPAAERPLSPRAVVPNEIYGASELAIGQREFLEAERLFAFKMSTLDGAYRKGLLASVMHDRPPMTMQDIEAVFANVQNLHKASDVYYQAVVKASGGGKFFAGALAALKSSKIVDALGKFLGSVLAGQQTLYNRLHNAPKKEQPLAEALAQLLDTIQRGKRANGASLTDLLSVPYQHVQSQKRALARLISQASDAGEKEALTALRAALDGIKGDHGAAEMDSKAVAKTLKWQTKMLVNDFGSLSLIDGEHRLLRIGTFAVKLPGVKKAKSHDAYLFHDALLLCEKKKVVAALDLSRAFDVTVRATSPAAFVLSSRNPLNMAQFNCECLCTARCDALNWVDDIEAAHAANKQPRK